MPGAEELIERLKDFRTRSAAKNELLEMGDAATPHLVAALKTRNQNVRWAAVSILGELGASQAIPDLIEALRDGELHSAAAEALRHITGQDLGDDYDAWKRWLGLGSTTAAPAQPEPKTHDDSDLIRQSVYATDVSADEQPPGYVLRVPLQDRHQDVAVNLKAKDAAGVPLVVLYTRCGPADPRRYEWALRQNIRMPAGAIAIADIEGKPNFVVVAVLLRPNTTPRLLIDSVRRIARTADQLEAALTKADTY